MNGHSPAVAERVKPVPSGPGSAVPRSPSALASSWIVGFVVLLITLQLALAFLDQLALLIGAAGPLRMAVRTTGYAASLLLLFLVPGQGRPHPASRVALIVLVIVTVAVFHPTTNTWLAGTAHAFLYLAILAPLFWVPRFRIDVAVFRRVLLILWGFHTLSAGMGVAQVYFPGFFQPTLSLVYASMGEDYLDSLHMVTAAGHRVFKPMGLTDTPGGASVSGFYAVVVSMGLLVTAGQRWLRIAAAGSMAVGMTVIYLSQVRSVLLVTVLCILVFGTLLALRGQLARLSLLATIGAMAVVGSFGVAVAVGGESVASRLTTLVEDRASEVYYTNRGHFLEETIDELLPRYPLGAGLGRHGMMNRYFGDNSDPERSSIWVEIQLTGWLVDGGVPLILAYGVAVLLACWTTWKIASRRASIQSDLPIWGALLFAYNIGMVVITFNQPLFFGQPGMEFWLLNAMLFAVARNAFAGRSGFRT